MTHTNTATKTQFYTALQAFKVEHGLSYSDLIRNIMDDPSHGAVSSRGTFLKDDAIPLILAWETMSPKHFKPAFRAFVLKRAKDLLKAEFLKVRRNGKRHKLFRSSKKVTRDKIASLTPETLAKTMGKSFPTLCSVVADAACEASEEIRKNKGQLPETVEEDEDSETDDDMDTDSEKEETDEEDDDEEEDDDDTEISRPMVLAALAFMLYHINRRWNILQSSNGIALWAGQTKKAVFNLFNRMGLSVSYRTTIDSLETLSADTVTVLRKVNNFVCLH